MLKVREGARYDGYTLLVASVAVGNVAQLTLDLLLASLSRRRAGGLWTEALVPVAGLDPYETEPRGLCTAADLYELNERRLLVLQVRSTCVGDLEGAFREIERFVDEMGVERTIILTSSHGHERTTPLPPPNLPSYLPSQNFPAAELEKLEKLGWKNQLVDQLKNQPEIQLENQRGIQFKNQEKIQLENQPKIQLENQRKIQVENQEEIQLKNEPKIQVENQEKIQLENQEKIQVENQKKIQLENQRKIQLENQEEIQLENQEKIQSENQEKIQLERQEKIRNKIVENPEEKSKGENDEKILNEIVENPEEKCTNKNVEKSEDKNIENENVENSEGKNVEKSEDKNIENENVEKSEDKNIENENVEKSEGKNEEKSEGEDIENKNVEKSEGENIENETVEKSEGKNVEKLGKNRRKFPRIPGGGFATSLLEFLSERGRNSAVVFVFCFEGDNVPDAVAFLENLNCWLNIFPTDHAGKIPLTFPPSWTHLFGNPPPLEIY